MTQTVEASRQATRSEELHIRNFDIRRSYDLTVRFERDGHVVFCEQYYLTPGKTVTEIDRIWPGEYEVVVELDGRRREAAICRVGPAPDDTTLVEVGNGTVSITEGHYR